MTSKIRFAPRPAGYFLAAFISCVICSAPAMAKLPFGRNNDSATTGLVSGPAAGKTADTIPNEGLLVQRRSFGVIVHPALEQQLNGVLQELQRTLPSAPPPAHVYAMPDTDFRAYGTADGGIFVAMGMLQSLESRDELAALLAHEYAHILLGHYAKSKVAAVTQRLYGIGSLYIGLRHGQSGTMTSNLTRHFLMNELALEGVQSAIMPALDRGQEDDADRLAADLVVRAGYNPVSVVTFLSRMVEWEARNTESAKAREVRAKEATRLITLSDGALSLDLESKMEGLITGIGSVATDRLKVLRRRHHPASKRVETIREYVSASHGDAERPDERPLPWSSMKEVQQLFSGVSAAHATADALSADNGRLALDWAAKASKSPALRSPYVRLITTQAQGKDPQGKMLETLVRELESTDSVFALHFLVIDILERSDPSKAMAVLQRSRIALGDPPELLPYSVRLNKKAGNTPAVSLYVAKCVSIGHRGLRDACINEQ